MSKERLEKDLVVRVQPLLFKKFKQKCDNNFKNVSEVIRDLMVKYIRSKDGECEVD